MGQQLIALIQEIKIELEQLRAENQEMKQELKTIANLTKANSPFLSSEEKSMALQEYQVIASQTENREKLSAQLR